MIEQDTIKLLRECDAGVKMGIASIDDVLDYVSSEEFKKCLIHCRDEHRSCTRGSLLARTASAWSPPS